MRLDFSGPIITEHGTFNSLGELDAANQAMCDLIARKLLQIHDKRPWGVVSEIEHGIVKIYLQGFTQWPVVIKIATLKGDPSLKSVTKYVGELLERLGLSREKYDFSAHREAMAKFPHHFNRNAPPPE